MKLRFLKKLKKIVGMLCLSAVFFSVAAPAPAYAAKNHKYASIVMDARTGKVLSQRYADKKLHPASLTKMMTLYMTFDALKAGRLSKKKRLRVSKHATTMQPSKLNLKAGTTIRTEDAILALVTKSANDVAVVLAEAISGSESQFARVMTRKAHQLGMKNTRFKNASGLHNRYQVSTARDMAKLSQALIKNHPEYYHYFSTNKFKYKNKTYGSHNKLMKTFTGMDGLKTGYVRASGFNLAASAMQDGRRLIGVVFGGRSSKSRNRHMASILNRGFVKADKLRIAKFKTPARNVRIPTRKPEIGYEVAALDVTMNPNTDILEDNGRASLVIGEGDADMEFGTEAVLKKVLMEMSQTTGGKRLISVKDLFKHRVSQNMKNIKQSDKFNQWSIQIGAFANKKAGHLALKEVYNDLPREMVRNKGRYLVPLPTQKGMIYRARFVGFDRKTAEKACTLLKNCIVLGMR